MNAQGEAEIEAAVVAGDPSVAIELVKLVLSDNCPPPHVEVEEVEGPVLLVSYPMQGV